MIPLFEVVLLELQARCNRSCFFCPRQGDTSGLRMNPNGTPVMSSMPTGDAMSVLDQLRDLDFHGPISFHHLSEPFLDSRTTWLARCAAKLGMRPYEHTNGDVLRRRPDLREECRVFTYVTVGLYDDLPEDKLEQERQYWRDNLPCEVRFSELVNSHPRTDVDDDPRLHRPKTVKCGPCVRPIKRMIIHYNGSMALCCEDMAESFDLGNVARSSVSDCWYSDKHQQLVEDLKTGVRTGQCSRCAL